MERRLLEAAQKGNIDELNDLIRSNGLILEEMALKGAGHTPLHIACVAGHVDFVRELLNRKLMPQFVEKVNADGFSPLHIAAARGDIEIVRELLRVDQRLCFVKGWERRIPLHYAVINGELDVMKVLLSSSPESVEETTAREEMALHLAVKNNRFDAVILLVEHLKKYDKERVINWKDHEGNTILHLAAASKNFEVVKFMLCGLGPEYEVMEVNALNESGLTPLDVLTLSQRGAGDREIREILARTGARHESGRSNSPASRLVSVDEDRIKENTSHQSVRELVINAPQSLVRTQSKNLNKGESLADIRNALLVVATLIASATYQAVLQPPSYKIKIDNKGFFGYIDGGQAIGYIFFMSGNSFGFLMSVQMIVYLTKDLPVGQPLRLSLYSMVLTYAAFMAYVPFTSMDKALSTKNGALFVLLPFIISILLSLAQRWLAKGLDFYLKMLYWHKIVGDMYTLKT